MSFFQFISFFAATQSRNLVLLYTEKIKIVVIETERYIFCSKVHYIFCSEIRIFRSRILHHEFDGAV